jgi:hypothetical protein
MNYSTEQQTAIKQVLTGVLSTAKPEEVFLVDSVFDQPIEINRRTDALGFGGGAEVILWLYPLFHVLCELTGDAGKGFAEKWGGQLAEWMWKKKPEASLEAAMLTNLRTAVVQRLTVEGVASPDSERVGDTLVAVLVNHPEFLRHIKAGD